MTLGSGATCAGGVIGKGRDVDVIEPGAPTTGVIGKGSEVGVMTGLSSMANELCGVSSMLDFRVLSERFDDIDEAVWSSTEG